MRMAGLILIFFIGLIVFLIAGLPLSKALEWSGSGNGLSYQRAYGTIWSGGLSGASLYGQPVGRISFKTKPTSLLSGALTAEIDVSGATGTAKGDLRLGIDRLTVSNLMTDLNVQSLVYLDPRLRQSPSTLTASTRFLTLTYKGVCLEGSASLQTDLLTSVGRQFRWDGPQMSGALKCENQQLFIDMKNDGGPDSITANLTVPDLRSYAVNANIETRNTDMIQALIALGFKKQGQAFIYSKTSADAPKS